MKDTDRTGGAGIMPARLQNPGGCRFSCQELNINLKKQNRMEKFVRTANRILKDFGAEEMITELCTADDFALYD